MRLSSSLCTYFFCGEKSRHPTTTSVFLGPLFTRATSEMGRRAFPAVCGWRGGRTAARTDRSTRPCVFVPPLAFKAQFSRNSLENVVVQENQAWRAPECEEAGSLPLAPGLRGFPSCAGQCPNAALTVCVWGKKGKNSGGKERFASEPCSSSPCCGHRVTRL